MVCLLESISCIVRIAERPNSTLEISEEAIVDELKPNTPKARLIRATLKSLHEYGLAETTVATITGIAGTSRGMITHHFASKSALMAAAFEQFLANWTSDVLAKRTDDHLANIHLMIEAQFDPINFTPVNRSAWFAFLEASLHDQSIKILLAEHYERWRKAFRDEVAGCLKYRERDIDPDIVTTEILVILDGIWVRFALEPELLSESEAKRICINLIRKLFDEEVCSAR